MNTAGGLVQGPDAPELYRYLVTELNKLNLAYLHILHTGDEQLLSDIRAAWKHPLLVNRPGAQPENLGRDIETGLADMVPVGQLGLANPDLVTRLKTNAPLNPADRATFFGGTEAGYTDYPAPRRLGGFDRRTTLPSRPIARRDGSLTSALRRAFAPCIMAP